MKNKLGLTYYKMLDVERKLVNYKLNLLDETYTFNGDIFSIDYLIKLNEFLFSDIHPDEFVRLRELNSIDRDYIKCLLNKVKSSAESNNIKELIDTVEEIWYYQPFIVGNTRTIIAYLKVINEAFLLDIPIDVNEEIVSSHSTFKKMSVNQKRLTRK